MLKKESLLVREKNMPRLIDRIIDFILTFIDIIVELKMIYMEKIKGLKDLFNFVCIQNKGKIEISCSGSSGGYYWSTFCKIKDESLLYEADFDEIQRKHDNIGSAQLEDNYGVEAKAVFEFYLAICAASHNVVILHLAQSMAPLLIDNIEKNLTILAKRPDVFSQISDYRTRLMSAIVSGKPQVAWGASHRHLAFIEEVLLKMSQENSRIERSIRRMKKTEF